MKEARNTKFFVLVPVYQTERYIRQCIDSILNQTYPYFEAILVDDGSPDAAGMICDEYAEKDSRIHVIHKKNEGQISARVVAITYVKENFSEENAFFLFLDSDDYFSVDALKIIEKAIAQYGCDLLFFRMQRVLRGKAYGKENTDAFNGVVCDKRELYKKVFMDTGCNSLCRKAIACHLLKDEDWRGYYYIRHAEDLLQSIPIYKACKKAVFIKDILYNYTVNPNSVTQSMSLDSYNPDATVRRTVFEFLQNENVFNEQDMKEYLDQCRKFLHNTLVMIGTFSGEPVKKKAIYKIIRQDGYYAMLLDHAKGDLVLTLLKQERYHSILIYAQVRNFVAKIYRRVKKLFSK